jgi:hypothetical protein
LVAWRRLDVLVDGVEGCLHGDSQLADVVHLVSGQAELLLQGCVDRQAVSSQLERCLPCEPALIGHVLKGDGNAIQSARAISSDESKSIDDRLQRLIGSVEADAERVKRAIHLPKGDGDVLEPERRESGQVEKSVQLICERLLILEHRPQRDSRLLHRARVVPPEFERSATQGEQGECPGICNAAHREQRLVHQKAALGRPLEPAAC